jgi:hypothetical protein
LLGQSARCEHCCQKWRSWCPALNQNETKNKRYLCGFSNFLIRRIATQGIQGTFEMSAFPNEIIFTLKAQSKVVSSKLTQVFDSLQSFKLNVRRVLCKTLEEQPLDRFAFIGRN